MQINSVAADTYRILKLLSGRFLARLKADMLFENRSELEENSAFVEKPFTARGLREAARFILFGSINPA